MEGLFRHAVQTFSWARARLRRRARFVMGQAMRKIEQGRVE
jgi:uncharacterized protein HemY